jgi:hypothetical protein
MAGRRFELDELILRPGTYFNPQTEVMLVVDDSAALDGEIFNLEEFEGAEWVQVADDVPLDESRRDELLQEFQVHWHGGDGRGPEQEYDDDAPDLDEDEGQGEETDEP